jgi:hypothetical protein
MKNTVFWDTTPCSLVESLLVLMVNVLPPSLRAEKYAKQKHYCCCGGGSSGSSSTSIFYVFQPYSPVTLCTTSIHPPNIIKNIFLLL